MSESQLDEIHDTLKAIAANLDTIARVAQGLLFANANAAGVPPTFAVAGIPPLPVKLYVALSTAEIPGRAHADDGGYDLFAAESVQIAPGGDRKIDTGLVMEIPKGWYGRIHARSGSKYHIREGIIDAGYRGHVKVWVFNPGPKNACIGPEVDPKNDAIAQITFHRRNDAAWKMVDSLDLLSPSDRGTGGFGSTNR